MSVRGNYMEADEVLARFRELFPHAHAIADALPDGQAATRGRRLLKLFHAAGNALWEHAADNGIVAQPFSGGDPDKE